MSRKPQAPKHSRLAAAVFAAMLVPMAGTAFAQETSSSESKATNLDKVTVTGSLIPQSQIETSSPVTVITAEDIHARGFTSIADVLQQNSMSSGGIQGGETSASFTQGAEAVSMFGLSPSYTKYLIDGRPMANYPALYNGSDVFNSVSGLPIDLVDRVEILPGGASSLYGSDALAGVVNIILKKDFKGTSLRVRGGAFTDGGGNSTRFSLTHGFSAADDRLNVVLAAQYESRDPIWGYQRDLTDSVNEHGYTAPVASRDHAIIGYFGAPVYYMPEGQDCSAVSGLFGGTEAYTVRPGYDGAYCGSTKAVGNKTIYNGKDSGQIYGHATFDFSDNMQLYADVLYSNEATKYATGSNYTFYSTGYFYDPNFDDLTNMQVAFAPEEIGPRGFKNLMNTNRTKNYQFDIGLRGTIGGSWDYDASFTRNESRYNSRDWVRFNDAITDYFANRVLGNALPGVDPFYNAYPIYSPDYNAFFSPISPEDFASFSGFIKTKAKTWDDLGRIQVTNSSLFSLPGGDAGIAIAAEVGNEGWNYEPDARVLPDPDTLESDIWGQTDVTGAGHRTRYAAMAELRLPIVEMLTASLSARYDSFDAYGNKVDKPTWSAGLEFRPIDSLLIRGKYGTAFKAPTLSDTYQGFSGSYNFATDYYQCGLDGFTPGNTDECATNSVQFFNTQEGNTDLKPITAKTWTAGIVWAPSSNISISADYYSWNIENEVDQLLPDDVLRQEYYCRNGIDTPGVTSCDNALNWVTRGSNGQLQSVYTPKVNIGKQKLEVIVLGARYLLDMGSYGDLQFSANYTKKRKHELQTQPGEAYLDLLNSADANWSYDAGPSNKSDAAVSWNIGKWTTTAYANRLGSTWNYLAAVNDTEENGEFAGKWKPYFTYNLGVDYKALDNLTLSLQVNNVLNNTPDFQAHNYPGTETVPYNNFLYSAIGRSVFAELRYDFGR